MLKHENDNIRYVARNLLSLDFNKRGAKRSIQENNFLGFNTTASCNLETHVKGGFGVQSDWPQLCHLVSKVGVRLHWEKVEEMTYIKLEKQRLLSER